MKLACNTNFTKLTIILLMLLIQLECRRVRVFRRPNPSKEPHGANMSFRIRNEFFKKLEGIVIASEGMTFNSNDEDQPICQFTAKSIELPSIELFPDHQSRTLKMIVRNAKIESHLVKKTTTFCIFESKYDRTFTAHIKEAIISFSLAGKIPILESFENALLDLSLNDSKWGKYSISLNWAVRMLLNTNYVKDKINKEISKHLWEINFDYVNDTLLFQSRFESFVMGKNFLGLNLQVGMLGARSLFERDVFDIYRWDADQASAPLEIYNSDMIVVLDESVFSYALYTFSQISDKISIRNQANGKRMVTISNGNMIVNFTLVYENHSKDLQIAFSFTARNGKIELKFVESESMIWNALGLIVKHVSSAENWFKNFIAKYENYFSKEFLNPYLHNYVKQVSIADFRVVLAEGKAYIAATFKKN